MRRIKEFWGIVVPPQWVETVLVAATENHPEIRSRQSHWDSVYRRLTPEGVSWHEPESSLSLDLIRSLELAATAPILDVGGGASRLVDGLVAAGYSDVSVLDMSPEAIDSARQRVGLQAGVHWLNADLLGWWPARPYALWHDRALFHFFTEPGDQQRYLELLMGTVAGSGYVIISAFAPDGPERCSGLPVARYSAEDLSEALAPGFEVIDSGRHLHTTPSERTQPFTWIVARARRDRSRTIG